MSILDGLLDEAKWQEFLAYKIEKSNMSKVDEQRLIDFVSNKEYASIASAIMDGSYTFSLPKKSLVNKSGSTKKRVVYSYSESESWILKFILHQMAKYDSVFPSNLFSFRRNLTVKKAFRSLVKNKGIDDMYAYKLDISNYFNSINIDVLLPILEKVLSDDKKLFEFISNLLTVDKSVYEGEVICEKRGAMAGTSISTFLANVYLMEMDKYFLNKKIIYARYSDDIIVFAPSLNKVKEYRKIMHSFVKLRGLTINEDKEELFQPRSAWSFLGFEYNSGKVDLSKVTLKKIKDKIRRKARALLRWRNKNSATGEHAMKVMLRVFNNKFYRESNTKNLTWSKWFFPIINTHKTLEEIDDYLIQYLRYVTSGKFNKKNYNITYSDLKDLGFRSLVHEFYKFKDADKKLAVKES